MSFTAKYGVLCGECSEPIQKGDQLDWFDGSALHTDCMPDASRDSVDRPTCPKCWQVVSVNGACGCDPE